VGTTPALAGGNAGVEPAGKAKKAVTAKLKVLIPWAQDKAGHKVERSPQEGKPELEARLQRGRRKPEALPPEGECECGIMLQGTPNEGTCEPDWLSQEPLHEVVPSTWEGPGSWDPGGGLTGRKSSI